ncbi:cysteine/serine-rich nuclear protein 1 [Aplochiton taeniatus]
MSGDLKRKFAEVDEDPSSCSSSPLSSLPSPTSSEWESDGESNQSNRNQDFTTSVPTSPTNSSPIRSILKKPKWTCRQSNVCFDRVTEFLFPRCQGFTSVPSRGGATLGMISRHSALHRYTLTEHSMERQRRRKQRLRERLREERLEVLRHKLTAGGAMDLREADRLCMDQVLDEDIAVPISDTELEDWSFLHPYSSKQRQAMLRASGVKRIDREEKRQLHALRLSREKCGCDCQGFCEPETCACSLAGIKCQMDRSNFPCGCTKDGCSNPQGRIEFNAKHVQTHYIHTVTRLQLEKQMQEETLCQPDQKAFIPKEHQETPEDENLDQSHPQKNAQEKSCSFGYSAGEDCLPLTMPPSPAFHITSPVAAVEESSASSAVTEPTSSSTISEDSGIGGNSLVRQPMLEVDGRGQSFAFNLGVSKNQGHSAGSHSETTHIRQPHHPGISDTYSITLDSMGVVGPAPPEHTNGKQRSSVADYIDDNANQATSLFESSPLHDFPYISSHHIDYSSSGYMDLSLSSDSDLELFDTDYSSGPLHNSFKGHNHPDNFHHLQLLGSSNLPQYNESSTCLLESLIGLSEPNPELAYSFTENLLLEVMQ